MLYKAFNSALSSILMQHVVQWDITSGSENDLYFFLCIAECNPRCKIQRCVIKTKTKKCRQYLSAEVPFLIFIYQKPVGYNGEVRRGSVLTMDTDETWSSGACRRVHFALFEFLHLGKDGAGEADNYWYLLPAIRERSRDMYRGRNSISTLLIRNSPSALCSLNKRSHTVVPHTTHEWGRNFTFIKR